MLIRKVLMIAEWRFRRLDAPELLADAYDGRTFMDGETAVKSIRKHENKAVA